MNNDDKSTLELDDDSKLTKSREEVELKKSIKLIKKKEAEERSKNKKEKQLKIKIEVQEEIERIKQEEEDIEKDIEAYDVFMEGLSKEDIEESKTRRKPKLKDIRIDVNGKQIEYERNTLRKGVKVKMKLSKEHVEELDYCFNHPLYTIRNYVKIINQDIGKMDFKLYDYQSNFIKTCFASKRVISSFPRQSGKTTTASAFMLIYAIYNNDKTVAIVANKQATAKEILERIKLMYDYIPMWMKPGIIEWNKNSIKFENGCKIIASATSSDSIRGQSIAVLYLDEFAFIRKNLVNQFIESTFPVISSSKLSRIIITSTPNGKNHFYKFFMDAKHHKSAFVALDIKWNDVPGRDDEWRLERIAELGSVEKFNQEYGAEFIEASNLAFTADTLRHIDRIQVTEHLTSEVKVMVGLKIFERPIRGQKYILIADVAGGKGRDSSTIIIMDITSENVYNIVATYQSNTISTIDYPGTIYSLALYYYNAFVLIENNGLGDGVVNDLWYQYEYSNVYSEDFTRENKSKKKAYREIGINTNKKNKKAGVLFLSALLDKFKIYIPDVRVIDEMYTFVKNEGGTYSASSGNHDDFVMNLVLFAYLAKTRDSFDILKASFENLNPDTDYVDYGVVYVEGGKLPNSTVMDAIESADRLLEKILMND